MFILNEAIAISFVLILGSLASGAGVGGGALYIPLFVILLSPNKVAIPLSKACAFGASVAMFIRNSPRTRRRANGSGTRPLIDYRMALILEPYTLVGTVIGVRLNKLLPFTVIATLMVILLVPIALKTFHRAFALHRAEQALAATNEIAIGGDAVASDANADGAASVNQPVENEEQFPWYPITMLFVYWAIGIFPTLLLSGRLGVHFECPSKSYSAIMTLSLLLLIVISFFVALHEVKLSSKRQHALLRSEAEDDEPQWTAKNVVTLSAVSLFAGILSALVGVGGSTIKGPFLAHICAPDVASSTAAFMLLSTCSSSMAQFIFLDMLDLPLALCFIVAGFTAAFFGTRLWNALILSLNKRSIIVFVLASYVSIATVAMTALSIYEIVTKQTIGGISSAC
ncbi:unnamed protein product (mitochondrion) [Plasmodiophora brassicae]|uniref:Uncharacterized protein n=1 Tax=Plasmodiophora brassicae TaxID=37360 RepID=A0A3P3YC90_PLABS|nr:unnamed protein product [Plasmodiophora brassicae]